LPSGLVNKLKVRVKRLPNLKELPLPAKQSDGSSGVDLHACVDAELVLKPGASSLVPTGISVEVPPGYEAQVRPRSGLALNKGVTVLNSPGTVDSDYRGEVKVILINHGSRAATISRGERIAQMVFCPVCDPVIEEADSLEETNRGSGGFGHTGD
jgi:dUTP pyrophosphatase